MGGREKEPIIPKTGEVPLGVRIRAFRRFQGVRIEELAERAGNYHQSYISKIENNKSIPSETVLDKIAEVLGTTMFDLNGASREEVQGWLTKSNSTIGRGRNLVTPKRNSYPFDPF